MKTPIYLDHAATTPIRPEVAKVMLEAMQTVHGNPSSIHRYGREARKKVDEARRFLARTINAEANEIIFTSGGSEADNLALLGTVKSRDHLGRHIVTSAIEHHAVLTTCQMLEKQGYEVTYVRPDRNGFISLEKIASVLREDTILVSIMFGNNEVGTIQPIEEIGNLIKDHQAYFHTDAVQAYGVMPIDVNTLKIDLLSVSSHKVNGPKGMGFLYQRKSVDIQPQVIGGSQERKRRAGTENVSAIIAFAEAVKILFEERQEIVSRYLTYEARLLEVFEQEGITFERTVQKDIHKLPHICNLYFPGTDIESLLVNLDLEGVLVSSGSACTAGSLDPSHVLTAMFGQKSPRLRSSVRFSFGFGIEEADVIEAAQRTSTIVARLVKTNH